MLKLLKSVKYLGGIILITTALLPINANGQRRMEELVSMNFNDMDIIELVRIISDWTGKNYLLDQRIRGRVTIISPRKVTIREALEIFHSILYANDLAMVEVGKIVKIVPAAEVRQSPTEIVKEKKLLPSEEYATAIITPIFSNADQISAIIRNFLSRNAFLQVYQPTNTIIIIDTKVNIQRIQEIVRELDRIPFTFTIELVKLRHSNSQDVVGIITQIIQAQRKPTRPPEAQPRVISDPRTNSIIIAAEKEDIEYIKKIISEIDIPSEVGEVNVIYLNYAKAEEVASVMQNIVGAGGIRAPGQAQVVQAPVRIAADKSTNSLIIIASPQDFEKIKEIISKIDIERRQVFVSAAIMEVSTSRLNQYGLSFLAGTKVKFQGREGIGIFGESVGAPLPFAIIDPRTISTISGLLFGFSLPPVEITLGDQKISVPPLAAVLNAFASDTAVDILSTPQLLTLDNKESEIRVATNIPFPTGQIITAAGAGGAAVPTITIQRQDVGIILKITPRVIEGERRIYMDINIEISDVAEEAPTGLAVQQLGIATIKRSASTSILIDDNQVAVIGGLMRTRKSYARAKVPILGDIPVIGVLFRSSQTRSQKSNLLIFINPKIIWKKGEIEEIMEQKIQEDIKIKKEEGMY
ncbi:MAG: type II secretion system secretin GspD [Candidatus Calescibacterium sp.]|nr:type II secretion system secretin GspD [Candidatus Calescibacterium sp.]MCX7734437.1 type II secretion system secretin GspD [bacterium]